MRLSQPLLVRRLKQLFQLEHRRGEVEHPQPTGRSLMRAPFGRWTVFPVRNDSKKII